MSGRPLQQREGYRMTHRSPLHPAEWDRRGETTGGKPTGKTTNSTVSKSRGAGKWETGQREEGERMDLESIRAGEERVMRRCVWTYFKWERRGRWGWNERKVKGWKRIRSSQAQKNISRGDETRVWGENGQSKKQEVWIRKREWEGFLVRMIWTQMYSLKARHVFINPIQSNSVHLT